jgi:hypothetical protein
LLDRLEDYAYDYHGYALIMLLITLLMLVIVYRCKPNTHEKIGVREETGSRLTSWGRRSKGIENASAARGGCAGELRRARWSKSGAEAMRSARAHSQELDFPLAANALA